MGSHHVWVFRDVVEPTLVPEDLLEASVPCSIKRLNGRVTLANGFLALVPDSGREVALTNRLTGETVAAKSPRPGAARTQVDGCEVRFISSDTGLESQRHFAVKEGDHFYHTWLTYRNAGESSVKLNDITVSALGFPRTVDLMAGQELTYPIYRTARGGIFQALEAVYWDHRGDALTYYPGRTLKPGESFESEKAAVGVYRNRGEDIAGWDRGLREWVIAYHDRISPVAPQWPEAYIEGWTADTNDLCRPSHQEPPDGLRGCCSGPRTINPSQ